MANVREALDAMPHGLALRLAIQRVQVDVDKAECSISSRLQADPNDAALVQHTDHRERNANPTAPQTDDRATNVLDEGALEVIVIGLQLPDLDTVCVAMRLLGEDDVVEPTCPAPPWSRHYVTPEATLWLIVAAFHVTARIARLVQAPVGGSPAPRARAS